MKEETKRRYLEREYNSADLRVLFKIGNNEMITDVFIDRNRNKLIVKSLMDFDKSKGDL